jgi:hypothetical protein
VGIGYFVADNISALVNTDWGDNANGPARNFSENFGVISISRGETEFLKRDCEIQRVSPKKLSFFCPQY